MDSLSDEDLIRLFREGQAKACDHHNPYPTEQDLRWEELANQFEQAFKELPEMFQNVLAMRILGGMSYSEMAHTLGIPRGEVMGRLWHAERELREKLAPFLTSSA